MSAYSAWVSEDIQRLSKGRDPHTLHFTRSGVYTKKFALCTPPVKVERFDTSKGYKSGIFLYRPQAGEKWLTKNRNLEINMRIRPYIKSKDYKHLENWIDNEKIHALWCANLISYPITKEKLHVFLEKTAIEWTDSAYVATKDNGTVIGFFCYSVNVNDNSGFLKFIIVDNSIRGKGYGKKMLQLALQYAFNITGVQLVQLNVFEENIAAKQCYEKLGFIEKGISKDVFPYKNELWSRCHMIIQK